MSSSAFVSWHLSEYYRSKIWYQQPLAVTVHCSRNKFWFQERHFVPQTDGFFFRIVQLFLFFFHTTKKIRDDFPDVVSSSISLVRPKGRVGSARVGSGRVGSGRVVPSKNFWLCEVFELQEIDKSLKVLRV